MAVPMVAEHTAGPKLRRDVTVWGSYMWGYADVGADIYTALGLVIAAAQGAAPLSFALAGLVYVLIGLAYTELAATYPVAGGGQYFALRGLGDFLGFMAGSALALDYIIDIALFATASAGYVNFFIPAAKLYTVSLGALGSVNLIWALESLVLIVFLTWLNVRGIRPSSLLNEVLGAIDIVLESTIVLFGFAFAFNPDLLTAQIVNQFPTGYQFMYGTSLAIISFVGLESISQASQETRRPATVVPRTSIALIITVFTFAVAFSTLGIGLLPWQVFQANISDPVATMAHAIPYLGILAGPLAAIMGATILLISANSGVMSVSRLTYSMSQFQLMPKWFDAVHPKYRTPYRTILVFSGLGVVATVLSFLTPSALDTLANMYAFGATTGYIIVFIALFRLRLKDPYSPRPYKMPFNIRFKYKGETVEFPVLGILGLIGVSSILFMVVLTHEIGRIAGPSWILMALIGYFLYRGSQKLPFLGNLPRDWEKDQMAVLEEAEEFEMLEQYKRALLRKARHAKGNGDAV
jgi:APA family basic amino acid/polyamine antiporter